jgi:hypothetical protein
MLWWRLVDCGLFFSTSNAAKAYDHITMELTMKPIGWSADGKADQKDGAHIIQYQVIEAPIFIRATITPRLGKRWTIIQDGNSSGDYPSAEDALEAIKRNTV